MSINVTVNGNPIRISRGKMVLSDLENIRKSEREHRRRLRLEQVNEQSKVVSKKLLERIKRAKQDQLNRLKDEHTDMRKAHEDKLLGLQRRYYGMENIGQAHENAARQPDPEIIKLIEEDRNKVAAKKRATEAAQRLQEANNVVSPKTKQQERLQKVRELENKRSCMVAQLPKKSTVVNGSLDSSEIENVNKSTPVSISKRRPKCVVSKKTPIKKISKHKLHHGKSPSRISVSINNSEEDRPISTASCMDKSKAINSSKSSNVPKTVSDSVPEVSVTNIYQSDDNEPRKTVPVTSSTGKPDDFIGLKYYQNSSSSGLSSTSTTSSSSISDDSSYFSDNNTKTTAIRRTPRHHTTPASSKVDLYDYKTRQKNVYDRPPGLVEKMNIKNKPNAKDLAREIIELETKEAEALAKQKEKLKQRSQDAILREGIKRDYQALMKNLDLLSKEQRKLIAKQISNPANQQVLPPCKISEGRTKKQKKMNRAVENIMRTTRNPNADDCVERPITITPHDYVHSKTTPNTEWKEPLNVGGQESEEGCLDDDINYNLIISELVRIEKLKRRLLQEIGPDLPDDVFSASVRSLFNNRLSSVNQERVECNAPKPVTPEIQVINTSCDESAQPTRTVPKTKKPVNKTPLYVNKTNAKNVSKRKCTTSTMTTCDQQVQVELEPDKSKQEIISHPLEPIVKIITPENNDSSNSICSNSSSTSTDVLIDVSRKGITVVPKDKENSVKITKEISIKSSTGICSSSSSSATDVRIDVSRKGITFVPKDNENSVKITKETSTKNSTGKGPVKISFENKNGTAYEVAGLLIDTDKKEITVLPKRKPKNIPKTVSKSLSPIEFEKSRSLPGSRTSSPVKKLSKSAPPSRQSSPKKSPSKLRQRKLPEKKIEKSQKICQEKSPYKLLQRKPPEKKIERPQKICHEEKKYKTQYTQVSINSSTESSQLNSTSENGNGKIYRYHNLSATRIFSQIQDSSDASTTYISPPAPIAGIFLDAMDNSAPIRELLDCSPSDSLLQRAAMVSPVSSPETPSPNTMKIPSNIPKPGQVYRSLKFTSLLSAQSRTASSSQTKTVQTSTCTTSRDASTSTTQGITTTSKSKSSAQTHPCTCKNPECKLFHDLVEDTHAYTLKHCPKILKRYEELQNNCTERIASLTDLIRKVRDEQKDVELSVVTSGDSSSLNQLTAQSQPSTSREVSSLVKNIEAIHAQLKKTLMDSQQIISGEGIKLPKSEVSQRGTVKSPPFRFNLSKDTSTSESPEEEIVKQKDGGAVAVVVSNKPKVLNDERVNIRLDRFRFTQAERRLGGSDAREIISTAATAAAATSTDQNEQTVEMLSKEILEQSKNINKSVPVDNLKDSDDSLLKSSQQIVKEQSEESIANAFSNDENNQSPNLETSVSDFIPLLAGIPKNLRKCASIINRSRPPVTLISGPYRPEIAVSPAHELSTIVELDTPDTVNKSQRSTRSPSNKCRKKLPVGVATQSTMSSPQKDVKLTKSKPSVHVAPLPSHRSPQLSLNQSNKSVTRSAEKSPRKSIERSSELLDKKKVATCEPTKSESSDSMHTLPDVHIEQLHQSQENVDANYEFRISQISEMCSLPDENVDHLLISEVCEESKSKSATPEQKLSQEQSQGQDQDKGRPTSTSSASLSGLSGVSEITTSPSSDVNNFKCPSSPEEMEEALKKWGLAWAIPTLKKTREASALGSSSSSDGTPGNAPRHVSPVKKHQDVTPQELPEISDVSSISIKHAHNSTERSVLVKGRTSTPNRLLNISDTPNRLSNRSNTPNRVSNLSNSNSNSTISTLGSFSSDLNIVVPNQSADMTIPNISFSKIQ